MDILIRCRIMSIGATCNSIYGFESNVFFFPFFTLNPVCIMKQLSLISKLEVKK